ncbi:MAG: hypothetical protein RLZ05_435 [Bacteroidota bacterium]|jgi:23S rRNA (pseudouridine1915-N3)-methyltransferase
MRICLWAIGKSHEPYVKAGTDTFTKRLSHYFKTKWTLLPAPKHTGMLSELDIRKKEADVILEWLQADDYLVLLDEKGKELSSPELAKFLQQRANEGNKNVVFLIGGAFGVDASVMKRANFTWSLSKLVFPHQLVRLILAEQLYRAATILRNEKYHHS